MNTTPAPVPAPAELLRRLIRFDTTNPPGNERALIEFVRDLLISAGIQVRLLARTPERPNLIARLPGRGQVAPLMMYGHADVVPTTGQAWSHPPFEGTVADGFIWGRGALDMKSGLAMMIAAMLRAKAGGDRPAGDIVLVIVSDEEAGGDLGARFLVEEHAGLFQGIRYAIGEFGGFTIPIAGKRFYAIQVAEKQACWLKATLRGPGGHGSMPVRDGAMAGLGKMLSALNRRRLPVHVTPAAREMVNAIASALGGASGSLFRLLLQPALTDRVLDLLGERGRAFDPLLHNTISPTVLHGSPKINVIPSQVSVELDGRLLPGYRPEDLLAELRRICPPDVEFELLRFDPAPPTPDMGLFPTLAGILRDADPAGIPIPLFLSGFTDARHFSRLGIQTYGFTPIQLPDEFNFTNMIHGADERVPESAIEFGTVAIHQLIRGYA